jgi:hypothetical protein
MSIILSNITLSNGEYLVTSSNPSGSFIASQPTTASNYFEYKPFISSNFSYNYSASIRDTTSNILVQLQGSNLTIQNQSSNLFSNFTPYLQPSSFNTIGINRYDNSVVVSVNASNVVRITSSNELVKTYSNSWVQVAASNGGRFKDITLQPVSLQTHLFGLQIPVYQSVMLFIHQA